MADAAPRLANPTGRFSDRVECYVAGRPGYPAEIVATLERDGGLRRGGTIADVGSGTGKSCEIFLDAGYAVIGVEPNAAMRLRGEEALARYPRFRSVSGRAEATTLAAASADAVVAAQAFHWFDPPPTRAEFARILRPGGLAVLIWNDRVRDGDPFHTGYEAMLKRHCPEYKEVSSGWANEAAIAAFFSPQPYRSARFENAQHLDHPTLIQRLLSSSYVPTAGPGHDAVVYEATRLFGACADRGCVEMRYETKLFFGTLG
jgi:SAM-dependent methyltransferase